MNANPIAPGSQAPAPRFDAKFIEDHRLLDRYLDGKLPVKGARDLENWCRANPDYLNALNLSGRTQASLRLLEACGSPVDLREPVPPWWKAPYVPIGLAVLAIMSLLAFSALYGKFVLLRGELADARTRATQGTLQPPAGTVDLRVAPDRAPDLDRARISVNRGAPQLIDLHIDMNYSKSAQFRVIVDKKDQGRALILGNLSKDSNGELRVSFNTTGLTAGIYTVRLEALQFRGGSTAEGWLLLDVH